MAPWSRRLVPRPLVTSGPRLVEKTLESHILNLLKNNMNVLLMIAILVMIFLFQVGIVSFGSSSGCETGLPAGFTR